MTGEEIALLVEAGIEAASVSVSGEDCNFQLQVISPAFAGLSRVRRQQLVYGLLGPMIRTGDIHAVTLSVLTPDEARVEH